MVAIRDFFLREQIKIKIQIEIIYANYFKLGACCDRKREGD